MIYLFLKTIFRHFYRKPIYQVLNASALTIGLAVTGVVLLFAWHEYRYDRFHNKSNDIYRLSGKTNDEVWFAPLAAPYSNKLLNHKFADIENVARVRRFPLKYLHYQNEKFYESKVLITDTKSGFFDLFNFKSVHGNLQQALAKANSVVLTESVSKKLFGNRMALGETLVFDSLHLTVTAVIEDLPSATHFDFTVLISNDNEMANASSIFTYVQFSPHADQGALKKSLLSMEVEQNHRLTDIRTIPLHRLHFENGLTFEMKPVVSKVYLLIFTTIGVLVLILSCVNYMNLAMALYAERAKEIAVRKVVGAHRLQLSGQLLFETVCISFLCVPGVLLLLQLILPIFNQFMGINIPNLFIQEPLFFLTLLGLAAMVGLLSGLYPAWLMPRINSLALLKSRLSESRRGWGLRTASITFQMTVMVLVISVSLVISKQLHFIQTLDLGFAREGVIKIGGAWRVDSIQFNNLKAELLAHPSVESVSQGFAPGDEDYGFSYRKEGSNTIHNDLIAFGTDIEYLKTLDIKLVSSKFGTSVDNLPERLVLINETLAKKLNVGDSTGEKIILNPGTENERTRIVSGIFRDFHFFSLHQPVAPMMLSFRPFGSGISQNILVRIKHAETKSMMAFVTKKSKEVIPNIPLAIELLDEDLQKQYASESRLSIFSTSLLCIAVVLSMIGLVGLAAHSTAAKTKEIGIRKVLGADAPGIVGLISKPFLKISILSFVLGSALSTYLAHQWLQGFAFKAPMPWQSYLIPLIALLFVLFGTVGWHSYQAANVNPVKSLRSE